MKKYTFFNSEVKQAFLNTLSNENTIRNYSRIFYITAEYEETLGKDINQFTLEEIEPILYSFEANNRHTIETYGRIISSYLNWCVQNGIVKNNPLSALTSDDFDKYVINDDVYFSEQQLRLYEDSCVNYQDAVILRLLFMGVGGKQLSEIRNLKRSDVDFQHNMLYLTNSLQEDEDGFPTKYTERTLKVDERTMYLIQKAMNEKTYTKRNFDTLPSHVREYTDLIENEYVVRASITRIRNVNAPVDKNVIHRRVRIVAETMNLKALTPKIIQRCGMLYELSNIVGNGDEVTLDDIKIVAKRFDIKSYHNLKSFLTIENVRKHYPKREMSERKGA